MGTSLTGTGTLDWESGVGLGLLDPQGISLLLKYPSQILSSTQRYGTIPSPISAPPVSLRVASSLYP